MKLYVVCWGNAAQDDDANSKAFCGIHGVYLTEAEAKKGLLESKNDFLAELLDNPDLDEEERQELEDTIKVYGSVDDDYFEIDYENGISTAELYIKIETKDLNE
jgi:hypothetical protein